MPARHKDFSGGLTLDDFEPLSFSLNKQTFHCKPAIQGSVLLEFVARADSDNGGQAAGALYKFFEDCMDAAEYERFIAVLNDPNVIIGMDLIGEIAGYLVEEYVARPTQQPESSVPGQTTSGPMSTAVAS